MDVIIKSVRLKIIKMGGEVVMVLFFELVSDNLPVKLPFVRILCLPTWVEFSYAVYSIDHLLNLTS